MEKILIAVDMQKDFINGSLGSEQARAIIPNVKNKIRQYEQDGGNIFFTQDTHGENYLKTQEGRNLPVKHCIKGTEGWEIYEGLTDVVSTPYCVTKYTFGYTGWAKVFAAILYAPDYEFELCGLCTDICVVSNALILKSLYPEAKITVDASCCAGVTEESHKAALLTMKMCQINIINE